jgi:hypothetical protein
MIDLFKKRKPNHLIVFINYKQEEIILYKFLSKLTYSVGPHNNLDDILNDIKKFIKKYPTKLKQINITSYGRGYNLIELKDGSDKINNIVDCLRPLIDENTRLMFTTCYGGGSHRKVVEMSEYLNGIEVSGLLGSFKLSTPMVRCKCKNKGYSQSVINNIPLSNRGMSFDEKRIVHLMTRKLNEETNWDSAGMAYEYNKKVIDDGVCFKSKQPYTLLKGIRNYIFNTQK